MTPQSRIRFETAWLAEGWRNSVVVSIDAAGNIAAINADDTATPATLVRGAAIPGMPNVHSHAFQRAMAGLAEHRDSNNDSFWTWREAMYGLAGSMSPAALNAIAAQLYTEMLKAGYTSVCEFHYLHHAAARQPDTDPLLMSQALIDAATAAGIGLTLLPTLYQTSEFGAAPPSERQRQFVLPTPQFIELVQKLRATPRSPQIEIGMALHSLRAVPPEAMREVLTALAVPGHSGAIHIHVAEQQREVAASLQHTGRRPIEWLLENATVDQSWCLVHATHATADELVAVARCGATIALCPTTEGNLGDGYFPLPEFLRAGGSFAIGSDSQISLAPCEELRWLEYQSRLRRQQRNICSGSDSSSVGATLWRMACVSGARASGRNIGEIKVGARADIVVVDTDTPLFCNRSADAIIDTFVFAGDSSVVRDVMVGGRWLVQGGAHFAETAIAAGYKRAVHLLAAG
ncbi:MAG TPA: formimidoylglutamate deiminase [Steroidobacteraceae bacterium]|jgi:formimidoylglutamate deiminase